MIRYLACMLLGFYFFTPAISLGCMAVVALLIAYWIAQEIRTAPVEKPQYGRDVPMGGNSNLGGTGEDEH